MNLNVPAESRYRSVNLRLTQLPDAIESFAPAAPGAGPVGGAGPEGGATVPGEAGAKPPAGGRATLVPCKSRILSLT